jgi:hypothetical protein
VFIDKWVQNLARRTVRVRYLFLVRPISCSLLRAVESIRFPVTFADSNALPFDALDLAGFMVLCEVETGSPHHGVRKLRRPNVFRAVLFVNRKLATIYIRDHRCFVPARDKATVSSMTDLVDGPRVH